MITSAIGGSYLRVADPDWPDPLDPGFAAHGNGRRWNPAGVPCLYMNHDVQTARANVDRLFVGLPYGPADLDPATAPLLIEVTVPTGVALDAFTDTGLAQIGLPDTFPRDASGNFIPHSTCQPIGAAAFAEGHDGVDCRSAADGGLRELAWYPRGSTATETSRQSFDHWW